MNYPLISEYLESIKSAEDNFEKLSYLRPVLGNDGLPVMTSGNFAVVFKMKDEQSGKFYAVKCFTKEQEGRAEAYREIAKELKNVSSPYLVSIRYLEKELFVDTDQATETEFPVLLMDWVEGKTLDKYLRENLDDKYALEMLTYRLSQLAQWLIPQPFAHGDLKPDNILVRENGSLVLVDYDGMYVPAMKGQKARELGSPDFRHPQRTEDDFDEHIDDFPITSILLSLKAISLHPLLLGKYDIMDRLLFSEKDYSDLSEGNVLDALKPLMQDQSICTLFSLLLLILSHKNFSQISYRLLLLPIPQEILLSTKETDKEFQGKGIFLDQNGVAYSKDEKRLLKCLWYNNHMSSYCIKNGVLVICNNAFSDFFDIWDEDYYSRYVEKRVDEITIPSTVIEIGANPFSGTVSKVICNSPNYEIEDDVLYDKRYNTKKLIQCFNRNNKQENQVSIPEGVTAIGERSFYGCNVDKVVIPRSVKLIGHNPFVSFFERDFPMEIISLSDHFKILDNTLYDLRSNTLISYFGNSLSLVIDEGTKTIGKYALNDNIKSICLPRSMEVINSFPSSLFIKIVYIPVGTKDKFEKLLPSYDNNLIEQDVFEFLSTEYTDMDLTSGWTDEYGAIYSEDRKRLLQFPKFVSSYTIKEGTQVICNRSCNFSSLRQITIPNSVINIGSNIFDYIWNNVLEIVIPIGTKKKYTLLLPEVFGLNYRIVEI